jgi:WD repeat-containing protein 48
MIHKEQKVMFKLSQDGNKLGKFLDDPSVSKLNSNGLLRIEKLISFVIEKGGLPVNTNLEILCNGDVLDPKLTLAGVKQFIWKSGNDLMLTVRLKNA